LQNLKHSLDSEQPGHQHPVRLDMMSQRSRLPSYLILIPTRTTWKVSQITSTDVHNNSLLCTDRSFLSASWPRKSTRLQEEVNNGFLDRKFIYDWAVGGLRRETEEEARARIQGEADDETLSEGQAIMRRRQAITLANGSHILNAINRGRRMSGTPQAKLAATNTDIGAPPQQEPRKSLRSRIAAGLKTRE
jgi:hypothetical protein